MSRPARFTKIADAALVAADHNLDGTQSLEQMEDAIEDVTDDPFGMSAQAEPVKRMIDDTIVQTFVLINDNVDPVTVIEWRLIAVESSDDVCPLFLNISWEGR